MLAVAARIPDAAARDQFADRLAHKARITEDVVRAEIRKAAVERRTDGDRRGNCRASARSKQAEKGLIWALVHDPEGLARAGRPGGRGPETLLQRGASSKWRGDCTGIGVPDWYHRRCCSV